jgi:UDP-N-acetylglucosamine--N-acetylmuramyl-(pentapeptide) pyrophosphoryl-undecaprenol N-acetylglucosamine transferase
MSGAPLVMMLAGGTGGHVYPALAVAEELRERGYRLRWIGTRRGLEARVVPAAGIPLHTLPMRGLRGKGRAAAAGAGCCWHCPCCNPWAAAASSPAGRGGHGRLRVRAGGRGRLAAAPAPAAAGAERRGGQRQPRAGAPGPLHRHGLPRRASRRRDALPRQSGARELLQVAGSTPGPGTASAPAGAGARRQPRRPAPQRGAAGARGAPRCGRCDWWHQCGVRTSRHNAGGLCRGGGRCASRSPFIEDMAPPTPGRTW